MQSFESFSEDPFLSGQLAAAYVNGLQDTGVGASIKVRPRTTSDMLTKPSTLFAMTKSMSVTLSTR